MLGQLKTGQETGGLELGKVFFLIITLRVSSLHDHCPYSLQYTGSSNLQKELSQPLKGMAIMHLV